MRFGLHPTPIHMPNGLPQGRLCRELLSFWADRFCSLRLLQTVYHEATRKQFDESAKSPRSGEANRELEKLRQPVQILLQMVAQVDTIVT